MPFARWLLAQHQREDDIGELARAAAKDGRFPRHGTYEEVKARILATMADTGAWATDSAAHTYWKEAGEP